MVKIKNLASRSGYLGVGFATLLAVVVPNLVPATASASQLTSRKLTLSSSANGSISTDLAGNAVTAGQGGNGAKANHAFSFVVPNVGGGNVGSIEFLYCTTPLDGTTCTAPTGMDASTVATVASQSGATGFTVGTAGNAPTANRLRITKTAAAVTAGTTLTYSFGTGAGTDWIKNPTPDNYTFFVRVTTFSDAAYTTAVDKGTVASATAQQIDITAKVQEKLNFSVGSTFVAAGGSCTMFSDSGALALGDPTNGVLDNTIAYDAYSYFRLNTNATVGAKVYYSGDTLRSGGNSITQIGNTATASTVGAKQFGLGLDSASVNHSFTDMTKTAPYSTGNGTITNGGTATFAYNNSSMTTPIEIASSASIVGCDTGAVRYIGNIASNTEAGVYTTTVTYIAVPTF